MISKPYVLTWRSDIDPGSVKIVGPFDTESKAASWGRVWQKAHQDNPCWQVINLDNDRIALGGPGHVLLVGVYEPGTKEANK